MSQDPNQPPTPAEDASRVPEADRPAAGPHTAGDPGATFPRDETMEGQSTERAPESGLAGGGAPQAADPGLADQAPGGPAERPAWGQTGASRLPRDEPEMGPGGAPQAADPGLADQAPGGPAERPAWGQSGASTLPRDEPEMGPGGASPEMGATKAGPTPMSDGTSHGQEPGTAGTVEEPPLDRFRERWPAVQGAFVDDPHAAVAEADRLVAEVIQDVEQRLTRRRQHIQGQWSGGQSDTEQLRQLIHGYRALFHRLLENEL